jgi:RHS repeat-associated protein
MSSLIGTTSSSGSLTNSYAYDPYGGSIGTPPLRFGFDGGYRLSAGSYHFGARHYDPITARWTQQDPITQYQAPAQANRFGFSGGDPVNASDPTGLLPGGYVGACAFYRGTALRNCLARVAHITGGRATLQFTASDWAGLATVGACGVAGFFISPFGAAVCSTVGYTISVYLAHR